MKTHRIVNEKYYLKEEIRLSPSDIETAIREFIENRIAKFQTGWNISVEYAAEANAVCSKWVGFTCPRCNSSMTVNRCSSEGCGKAVCEGTERFGTCCECVI